MSVHDKKKKEKKKRNSFIIMYIYIHTDSLFGVFFSFIALHIHRDKSLDFVLDVQLVLSIDFESIFEPMSRQVERQLLQIMIKSLRYSNKKLCFSNVLSSVVKIIIIILILFPLTESFLNFVE